MKINQYANLHFEDDAKVEVSEDRTVPDETFIRISSGHMNVGFHMKNDELGDWVAQWMKLWSSTYSYSDTHLSPSFTVFVPRVLFEELSGKVFDHLAYMEEVKV